MSGSLSTGIEGLDRVLGERALERGVVVVRTPPESQGEVLLKAVAAANDSLYVSTTRTGEAVGAWLANGQAPLRREGGLEAVGADELSFASDVKEWLSAHSPWRIGNGSFVGESQIQLEAVTKVVAGGGRRCVVVDPVNPLERSPEPKYLRFLQVLKDALVEGERTAFLHVVESQRHARNRWLTMQFADEVWNLSLQCKNEQIRGLLTVTKSRSAAVPERQIRIEFGDGLDVDSTRDIDL